MTFNLWPHQKGAIATTLYAVESGRKSGLWVMPTGDGQDQSLRDLGPATQSPYPGRRPPG